MIRAVRPKVTANCVGAYGQHEMDVHTMAQTETRVGMR